VWNPIRPKFLPWSPPLQVTKNKFPKELEKTLKVPNQIPWKPQDPDPRWLTRFGKGINYPKLTPL